MTLIPRQILHEARLQRGLVTLEQLQQHELGDRRRRRLLSNGLLVPVHKGVYRISSHPATFEQRCLAACLLGPDVTLAGPTAGRLHGLRKCMTEDIHVIARRPMLIDGIHAHRTNLLDPSDIIERNGLRLLRPARLICDLAAYLSDADLESVIEQALERRMLTLSSLRTVGGRFMRSGRNGTRRLATVLNSRPTWTRPPESDLEVRLLRTLTERGLVVVPQYGMLLDGGREIRFDMADPAIKLAIEVDHVTWHTGRMQVQRDKSRDRATARLGWTTVRVTDEDIDERFAETVDELVELSLSIRHRVAS